MLIIKDINGYHKENELGHPERNQMGDIVYYETPPLESVIFPITNRTKNPLFKNPFIFNPFES